MIYFIFISFLLLDVSLAIEINVPANQKWLSTEIYLNKNELLSITASGIITYGISSTSGPEGINEFRDYFPCPSAKIVSLIGKINGKCFYIGNSYSGLAIDSGILYLGINDEPVSDNSGQWNIIINLEESIPENNNETSCGNGEIEEGETCLSCPSDVQCLSYERCENGICSGYCGNAQEDEGETCSSCPQDIKCASYEICENGICKGYCGNTKEDAGENCANCPVDIKCASYERCENGICSGFCGNGRTDNGETCSSCPQDVSCEQGWFCIEGKCRNPENDPTYCGSERKSCGTGFCVNGQCVECRNNKDCESKKIYGEGFECSPDRKHVLEKGYELSGLCKEGKCTGERVALTPREYEDCGDKGCQDGHCGCSEGYKLCKSILECKKPGLLKENTKCNCDFECQSGYCSEDNKCINTLNVKLSANKNNIGVGEETSVTLSVDNNLNKVVNTNLAINIGDGFDITEVDGGMHCSGNQCKSSLELSERSRTQIIIGLEGKSSNVALLNAEVTYFMDDGIERSIPEIEETKIIVTNCGDGECTEGENIQNCCTDCGCPKNTFISNYICKSNGCERQIKSGFWNIVLIFVLGIIIIGYISYNRLKKEKNQAENIKKELKEKNHIWKILSNMKVLRKKPLTPKQIIEKLKEDYDIDYDKRIITETYIEFLNKREFDTGGHTIKRGDILTKKYCSNCGTLTKKNKPFCHKCGGSIVDSSKGEVIRYCNKCGEGIKEKSNFCPSCSHRIGHQIFHKDYDQISISDHKAYKQSPPKKHEEAQKSAFKKGKRSTARKSKFIAVLLAYLLSFIAGGYIYLGKWTRFWVSIILIWVLLIIGGDTAYTILVLYIIWTMYDCYKLAKRTQ